MDLDVIITKEMPTNNKYNWLYIHNGIVEYIRNNYKTVSTYGIKKHIITDPRFYKAVSEIISDNTKVKLLSRGKSGLSAEIIDSTYDLLGEGTYFKIMIENETMTNIERMSDNRGTKIQTVFNFYNINKSS